MERSAALELPQSALSGPRAESATPWAALSALVLGHLAVDACAGIWPVYKTLAGLDVARAGLVATAAGVLGSGSQIAFGLAADRGHGRALLVAGVVLAGSVLLLPLAGGWAALAALVLLTSVGSAMFHPAGTGLAGSFSRQRTGVLVACFLTGGFIGFAASQLVFTAAWRAWGAGVAVLLAVPLAAAAVLAATVPAAPRRRLPIARALLRLRRERAALAALFASQTLSTALASAVIFLLPDLLSARQTPRLLVEGGGHAALVLGACLSLFPAGYAADRFGARATLLAANAASILALSALLAWPGASPVATVALIALFGCCNGANNVVAAAEGNRRCPGIGGLVSALLMGLPWCLAAVTPAIVGHLVAIPGGSPGSAIAWMLVVAPPTLAACLLITARRR